MRDSSGHELDDTDGGGHEEVHVQDAGLVGRGDVGEYGAGFVRGGVCG